MRFVDRRFVKIGVSLAACLYLGGCQLLDMASLEPRSYEVNHGSQSFREEVILLNVVRASFFEPLNFTTLSKYTASGTLGVNGSMARNVGIDFLRSVGGKPAAANVGSSPLNTLSAGGNASQSNSFDLAPMDNSDFYTNFLAALTPAEINLLVNAGLSREVVFYSIVGSIDVKLSAAGQALVTPAKYRHYANFTTLRYNNSPSDSTWNGVDDKQAAFDMCTNEAAKDYEARTPSGNWAPFYTRFWYGSHLNDCRYQKFLMLIREAFSYGVTTAAVEKAPNTQVAGVVPGKAANAKSGPAGQKGKPAPAKAGGPQAGQPVVTATATAGQSIPQINITITNPISASSGGSSSGSAAKPATATREIIICYDPAIAAANNIPLKNNSICSTQGANVQGKGAGTLLSQPLQSRLGQYDDSVEPILRSPYGVFQYYGELIRTRTKVDIVTKRAIRKTDDAQLFVVTPDVAGCFVHVNHGGGSYCIPSDNANPIKVSNTKEVLTLLIALVNLSTTRSSLPATQTAIVAPQ